MKNYLKNRFALSDAGASGLIQAVVWTYFSNLALMLPVFLVMATIARMTDLIEGSDVMAMWPLYPLIAAALLVLLWVIHYFQYAALYLTVFSEGTNRRIDLAERLRKLPLSFFGRRDLSDLTSTLISDEAALEQMFSHYIPQAFATCGSVLTISVLLLVFNWKMGLAVTWVIPVALLLVFGSRQMQDRLGRKNIQRKKAVTEKIQEGIEHMQDIKAFDLSERYGKELEHLVAQNVQSQLRAELVTGSFVSTGKAFVHLGIASGVLVGVTLLARGELSFLYFLGYMFAAARMYDPVEISLENISATFAAGLKIERMRAIQEEPLQTGSTDLSPDGFDITFSHVDFAYDGEESVLRDVSFTARQGEVTALVGSSGSGKSTIARLAARFWDIQGGSITLGGQDISAADPETLLGYYSIVFQDVVLFNDTILENIRLGRKDATDKDVLEAARLARCDEFVQELPSGYQTMIGENGARLSGGERQRISIARALLKDAPVVLLDEATASLDVENETQVQKALSRLLSGRTVIVIAHRMRTVAQADHLIVLKDGQIAEEGTPQALLDRQGLFAKMVQAQNKTARWRL